MHKRTLSRITVRRKPGDSTRGWLTAGQFSLPVALGRGGLSARRHAGEFLLDAKDFTLLLPRVFRGPIEAERLAGRLDWERKSDHWQVRGEDLRLAVAARDAVEGERHAPGLARVRLDARREVEQRQRGARRRRRVE